LVRMPHTRIGVVRIAPDAAARTVTLTVDVTREAVLGTADRLSVEIRPAVQEDVWPAPINEEGIVNSDGTAVLTVSMGASARLWSDRDPYLYVLQLKLMRDDRVLDTVERRFGLRTIQAKGNRILLNGEPV